MGDTRKKSALESRLEKTEACAVCQYVAATFKDQAARAVRKTKKRKERIKKLKTAEATMCDMKQRPEELGYYHVDGVLMIRDSQVEGDGNGKQEPEKDEDGKVKFGDDGRPIMRWKEVKKKRIGKEVRLEATEACVTFVLGNLGSLEKEVGRLHIRDTDWGRVICEKMAKVCPKPKGSIDDIAPDFGRVEL